MASTPVQIQLASGLSSPTLTLYADGSDSAANTPDTLTEETNRLGLYEATVTENLSGVYYAKALDGASLVGSGWVTLADDTSEYQVIDNHPGAVAEAVWDAAASDYNVGGTFGKFLRQIKEGQVSVESAVNDVSATTTSFVTDLTEASDSHYSDLTVAFISGNLTGQSRVIESYNGTTKTLTFDEAWSEAPADGDGFIILTTHTHTKSQIADSVWDELTADHTISGSTGEAVAASGGLTQQNVADALKLAPTAGTPASGSVNSDIDTLLSRTAGGVTVSTSGTTNADGDFTDPIVRGDAYNAASGNAFTVSSTGFPAAVWDAVVTGTLKIKQRDTVTTTGTVTVTHDSDETITASIALTTAETEALIGNATTTYEVELVVGTDKRTITGNWRVADSDES